MKKQLFILFLIVIFSASDAFSQQKPFVFGFKAGPNIGWMNPDSKDYKSVGVKPGFSWGFIADFFLMENYGITTGFDVVFLNGGLEMPYQVIIDNNIVAGTLTRNYHLKYIQVPLTLKMRTNELGKFRVFGQIGLGTNFLIGAKADDEFSSDGFNSQSDDEDIYDDITFMRESLILGAGVEFSLGGSTSLMAAIMFNNGFMDILKGKNSLNTNINNKATANYFSLEVGIVF